MTGAVRDAAPPTRTWVRPVPTTRSARIRGTGPVRRFVERQFGPRETELQYVFDALLLCALGPLVCLPLVTAFSELDLFVWIGRPLMAACVLAGCAFVAYRFARAWWTPAAGVEQVFAGIFAVTSVVAGAIGSPLLPLALPLIFVAVGLVLLMPFAAALTLARTSVRCLRRSSCPGEPRRVRPAFWLGAIAAVAIIGSARWWWPVWY